MKTKISAQKCEILHGVYPRPLQQSFYFWYCNKICFRPLQARPHILVFAKLPNARMLSNMTPLRGGTRRFCVACSIAHSRNSSRRVRTPQSSWLRPHALSMHFRDMPIRTGTVKLAETYFHSSTPETVQELEVGSRFFAPRT